jgi:hypothetical protein
MLALTMAEMLVCWSVGYWVKTWAIAMAEMRALSMVD